MTQVDALRDENDKPIEIGSGIGFMGRVARTKEIARFLEYANIAKR